MIKKIWERLRTPPSFSKKTECILTVSGMVGASIALTLLILWIGTLNCSLSRLLYYFKDARILIFNYLPIMVLMGIFYLLFNRAWISFLLTASATFILSFVNYFKVIMRSEPLIAMDLTLIFEAADIGGNYTYKFPKLFWLGIIMILLGTALLARYARAKIHRKWWWTRILGILLICGLVQFLWAKYYSDLNYHNDILIDDYSVFNDWKGEERMAKRGYLYSFIVSINDALITEPPGYDEELAIKTLEAYESQSIPEDKKVNVIFHMLESFSDLSVFDLDLQSDPYTLWHSLEEESYHGILISDILGGGTNNAERSVMTGFTFPHPGYHIRTNSYVHYFSANGYYTQAIHPGDEWFYDRAAIDRRLGFDSVLLNQNYFKYYSGGVFGKDSVVLPLLREQYEENSKDGQRYFGFHVTYQNHSPYEKEELLGTEYISQAQLQGESYYMVNNYLNGIEDTCRQVYDYVEQYRWDETPVVLIFFGDHKPLLGDSGEAYTALGICADQGTSEGVYNLYTTPYVIWANDAAKEILGNDFTGTGPTISQCYLMNEVFDICGWVGNSWLQYQNEVRKELPVIQRKKWLMVDGAITPEYPAELNEKRLQRLRVEFYWRYNMSEY
ncbi:MAG: sulfatase-like hydrolase/transferase [Oscillospiraceae bacterium]|nr:sulfatase-like hydrolase/transferase [Oscillospiraceae bacterium]